MESLTALPVQLAVFVVLTRSSVADIDKVTTYAEANKLAGVHFWSLDRDTPCSQSTASPTCNSLPSTSVLQYTKRFLSDLGY